MGKFQPHRPRRGRENWGSFNPPEDRPRRWGGGKRPGAPRPPSPAHRRRGSPSPPPAASEACCELCGLYFENRKALASHARAHLRQFGVTEWCVNGSPIETLSEWIRHRPQKAGAYRSYIQGGRPFTKKFRNSAHGREHDGGGARRVPLGLQAGGVAFLGKGLAGDLAHGDGGKLLEGAAGGERPLITSPLSLVKVEEHQRSNINSESGRGRGGWSGSGTTPAPLPLPGGTGGCLEPRPSPPPPPLVSSSSSSQLPRGGCSRPGELLAVPPTPAITRPRPISPWRRV